MPTSSASVASDDGDGGSEGGSEGQRHVKRNNHGFPSEYFKKKNGFRINTKIISISGSDI